MASETIIIEYIAQVEGMRAQLKTVEASLKKVETTGKESAKQTTQNFQKAGESIKQTATQIAGALGLAFGVATLVNFGKEAVTLASKAEGIKKAFAGLNNAKLLDELRKATKGTVSDLELMKSAVQFNNFKLPLNQMAGLFQFASQRARETGESVDYLTNSIVLGIARKSIPILDNLGISSVEIQKEFKKTGDFAVAVGNIVNRELALMGDVAETTADKMARINSVLENTKVITGEVLIKSGADLLDFFDIFTKGFDAVNEKRAKGVLSGAFQAENEKIIAAAKESESERIRLMVQTDNVLKTLLAKRNEEIIDEESGLFRERTNAENLSIDVAIRNQIKLFKELQKIGKTETKVLTDEEVKAQIELQKSLRDLRTASIINQYDKEKQLLFDKFEDDKKIALGDKDLQRDLALKLGADLTAVDDKYFSDKIDRIDLFAKDKKGIEQLSLIDTKNIEGQALKDFIKNEDAKTKALLREEALRREIETAKFQFISDSLNAAFQIQQNLQQEGFETQIQGINEVRDKDIEAVESQFNNRLITQDQYEKQKAKINLKAQQEESKIKKRAFEANKEAAIVQAVINTAIAVAKTFAEWGYPAGIPLAALAAASGALQIAVISSQPTPKFEKGGLVGGKRHSAGGTLIEAEKGEFVNSVNVTNKHHKLLEAMQQGREQKYIQDYYIAPILRAQIRKQKENKDNSFASNIANSLAVNSNFKDGNLLDSMKQSRKAERENFSQLIKAMSQSTNKRNW